VGYILTPIAVDLDEVRGVIGSKKKSLLSKLRKAFAGTLDQIDEMLADRFEDEDEEGDENKEPITTADVLRHLVMGEPYREGFGFAYGYWFESLCLHFGDFLNNSQWSAMHAEWFETVQKALTEVRVSKKVFTVDWLAFRGPPIELPEIDDFPGIGYLTKTEVVTARAALAKADLSKLKNKRTVPSIEQIRSWLDECAKSNRDLVCTYA
jgi:hypothetical protein